MKNEDLILIEQLCSHYHVEISFIESLSEYGLIEIMEVEQTQYVSANQLKDIEKMIRLHFELNINMEGIDAIYHLLQKMDRLQYELKSIQNQLRFYNPEDKPI